MPKLKLYVIEERDYNNCSGVLIQNQLNSEIRIVKLSEGNQFKFNRNLEKDIIELWKLYETNPKEYNISN